MRRSGRKTTNRRAGAPYCEQQKTLNRAGVPTTLLETCVPSAPPGPSRAETNTLVRGSFGVTCISITPPPLHLQRGEGVAIDRVGLTAYPGTGAGSVIDNLYVYVASGGYTEGCRCCCRMPVLVRSSRRCQ